MSALGYQYSPSGFRTRLLDVVKTNVEPDDLISAAWAEANTATNYHVSTWDFKRKVINRALDRFHNFGDWLRDQESNPRLTPQMRKLIEETIAFINTGIRPVSFYSRVSAMQIESENKPTPPFKRPNSKLPLYKQLVVNSDDYMWHWLKHPNGFNDMLQVVNVIFGDVNQIVIAINKLTPRR